MADFIRINDQAYSWSSVILKMDQQPYTGVTSIEYGDSRERAKGYGIGRHHAPTRRSAGKYVPDPVKIKGYASTIQSLIDSLAMRSANGISYGNVKFPIMIQLIEPGSELPMMTTIDGCVITKISSAYAEGPELLMQDIECDCMAIYRNKKTLFDSTRGFP